MLTRLYILLALLLSLLFTLLVALVAAYRPATPAPINIYHSDYPVITAENVANLTPVAILSRGATSNYENALSNPVWSPDGRYIAARDTGAEGGTQPTGVFLYDITDPDGPPRLFEHEGILINHAFSPDGVWLATITHPGYVGGKMIVWDVQSGQPQFELITANLYDIRFSLDKTRMAAQTDALLRMWDTQSRQEIVTLGPICGFDFNQTMTIVAVADCHNYPSVFSLRDIESGQRVSVGERDELIALVVLSPDLQYMVTGDYRGTVELWDLPSSALNIILTFGVEYLRVQFSPDGAILAFWTTTGDTIQLWDVESGGFIAALEGHSVPGYDGPAGTDLGTAFSPNAQLIISSWPEGLTEDRNTRLWDTTTGALLRTLPDEFSATFSPDGTMLATDSADGTIKIWAVSATF